MSRGVEEPTFPERPHTGPTRIVVGGAARGPDRMRAAQLRAMPAGLWQRAPIPGPKSIARAAAAAA
eukprot:3184222-Alexandrium_andersonii.AAC.1